MGSEMCIRDRLTTNGAVGSEAAIPPSEGGVGSWGGDPVRELPSNTNDGLDGRHF